VDGHLRIFGASLHCAVHYGDITDIRTSLYPSIWRHRYMKIDYVPPQ